MAEEFLELKPPYRIVREFDFTEVVYPRGEPTEAIYGFALGFLVSVIPGEDQETTLMILDRPTAIELRDRLNALLAHPDTHH